MINLVITNQYKETKPTDVVNAGDIVVINYGGLKYTLLAVCCQEDKLSLVSLDSNFREYFGESFYKKITVGEIETLTGCVINKIYKNSQMAITLK